MVIGPGYLRGKAMAYEFAETLPERVPDSLPVYRLHDPPPYPASAATLARVGRQIGLEGRAHEVSTTDDWTMHFEAAFELGIHQQSGALVGRHRERYQRQGERSFELGDEEAQGLAVRFLERSELVPASETGSVTVTHLRTAGRDAGEGELQEQILDAGVVFRRTLEGAPVDGPGGLAMIHVDSAGEVAGFRIVWRPVAEAVGEVRIQPPDEAREAIAAIAKGVRGDLRVTKASFGYFEHGVSDRQRFLQPAYVMVYVVQDEEVAFKSAHVVAAGDRVFEPLMGEKRFPIPPQPSRERPEPQRNGIG
jgi:hypothetical protein